MFISDAAKSWNSYFWIGLTIQIWTKGLQYQNVEPEQNLGLEVSTDSKDMMGNMETLLISV